MSETSGQRVSQTAERFRPFGTTIFAEITQLAVANDALNLGQGFPNFEGPPRVRDAAVRALQTGHNQYARSRGILPLVEKVAEHRAHFYGTQVDPEREVVVTAGATEGIASAMLGLVNPGDEVIVFEPFYDSYPATVAMAGGVLKTCPLELDPSTRKFGFDRDRLAGLFSAKTRLLVLNTPHNPTGKVFTQAELEDIADLCQRHDVLVLADEVYEHLTFDDAKHVPMATLPSMAERTLTLSSIGKTFSFTGWKIGWAVGAAPLVNAQQAAHQFLTYAVATPLQHAAAEALEVAFRTDFLDDFRSAYASRRATLQKALTDAGFLCGHTEGTYFTLARYAELSDEPDQVFARTLIEEAKVAAIPPSVFSADPAQAMGERLMRFAFCKTPDLLEEAGRRLAAWRARG